MNESTDPGKPRSDTIFDGLPSLEKYYLDEDGKPIDPMLLYGSFKCQECENLKPDVIGYTLPTMILLPRLMRYDYLVKCRRCMRLHIARRLWLAILLAHIFSPLIVIWWAVVFVQTFYRKPS
jgi:hypothetical protein